MVSLCLLTRQFSSPYMRKCLVLRNPLTTLSATFQSWREISESNVEEGMKNGSFSFSFHSSTLFSSLFKTKISSLSQDIRSFFSPKGKTAKPGPRGKDSTKAAAKQDSGKSKPKSKIRKRDCIVFSLTE